MAIFETSDYTFNIHDTAYINALVTCVGQLNIDELKPSVEGLKLANKKIEDLPQLIKHIKAKLGDTAEVTLKTRYDTLLSLQRILPEFEPQDEIEDPKLEPTVQKTQAFIREMTDNTNDLYMIPPPLAALTKEEAWAVVNASYKHSPFYSAVDLPSNNRILILTRCGNCLFNLHYGPEKTEIEYTDISFDIDDGFVGEYSAELNTAFQIWLKNNREGTIFAPPKNKFENLSTSIAQATELPRVLSNVVTEYAYTRVSPQRMEPHQVMKPKRAKKEDKGVFAQNEFVLKPVLSFLKQTFSDLWAGFKKVISSMIDTLFRKKETTNKDKPLSRERSHEPSQSRQNSPDLKEPLKYSEAETLAGFETRSEDQPKAIIVKKQIAMSPTPTHLESESESNNVDLMNAKALLLSEDIKYMSNDSKAKLELYIEQIESGIKKENCLLDERIEMLSEAFPKFLTEINEKKKKSSIERKN